MNCVNMCMVANCVTDPSRRFCDSLWNVNDWREGILTSAQRKVTSFFLSNYLCHHLYILFVRDLMFFRAIVARKAFSIEVMPIEMYPHYSECVYFPVTVLTGSSHHESLSFFDANPILSEFI